MSRASVRLFAQTQPAICAPTASISVSRSLPSTHYHGYARTITPRRPNPRFRSARTLSTVSSVCFGALSPEDAIETFQDDLLPAEIEELTSFTDVWYVGTLPSKHASYIDGTLNYRRLAPGSHVCYRYEVLREHSSDPCGQNVICLDHQTRREVLLKGVPFPSDSAQWADSFVTKSPEVSECPFIVKILGSFQFRNFLFIEFESAGESFFDYLQKIRFWEYEDRPVLFPPVEKERLRKVAQEVLFGLRSLHSCDLSHGNVLARNILQTDKVFQLFGFGFDPRQQLLPYRAPEAVMGLGTGPPADIWSLGCLMIELVMRRVPFPGANDRELFVSIMDVIGPPPKALIAQSSRRRELLGMKGVRFRDPCLQLPGVVHRAGATRLLLTSTDSRKYEDSLFADFVRRCLEWWPQKRMTAEEALRHPWIGNTEVGAWKKLASTLPSISLKLTDSPL
jgi:dual specificity tyrosine-phosphorylation-regulated kinase 2/3/4